MKLYEISEEIEKAEEASDSGVESEALSRVLDNLQVAFEQKVEQICKIIQDKETDVELLSAEVGRLQSRKAALVKQADWLRNYLKYNMDKAGIPKIKTALFGVTLSDSPPKVDIFSIGDVPSEFVKTEIVRTPDKKAILEYVKTTGEVPPGCEVTVGKTLRIK